MSLAILFHFLFAQHVSDINISIIRSLRLFCWITTLVVLFLVRYVSEFRCGWFGVVYVLQAASACNTDTRKLLMIDILMSETCRAHKKWNTIGSDIKLVFYSSTSLRILYSPNDIASQLDKFNHQKDFCENFRLVHDKYIYRLFSFTPK